MILVVGLGCDGIQAKDLASEIATTGKKVDYVVIQECGGTLKTVSKGAEIVGKNWLSEVSKEVELNLV